MGLAGAKPAGEAEVQGFESPPPHHLQNPPLDSIIAAKIFEHALWMKREGYRPSTIRAAVKTLKAVGRRCDILDPNRFRNYLSV